VICIIKVAFVVLALPETVVHVGRRAPGVLPTLSAAADLIFFRNSFISRMALVFVLSGQSLAGLATVAKPYLTGYLGVDRPTGARLVFVCGCSVMSTIYLGLKPLVNRLGEVRTTQCCLGFLASLPLLYCACSEVWHVFVLAAVFSGPMVLQFPVITAIKSNLVNEEEQGLMQGALASFRVLAEAVAGAFFGAYYSYSTHGGTEKDRTKAFPPFVLASFLGGCSLLLACTLPDRPPPPMPKSSERSVLLPGETLADGSYSTMPGTSHSQPPANPQDSQDQDVALRT